ncbi:hypothetical protein [Pseudoroseicyclus aestuarii]|uniref:Uncharacterized protein n=1 Tax=Pseudoroseicyclus aestuarii TaxID=1795041 RepID=A0A318SUY8_9RHOB|nr:hypothetical protein [Pseudoroseicyclus aestuarii]PYE84096.1 hypothetical protein DFP88_103462 [Pseudoroseicyclus aestuarii]
MIQKTPKILIGHSSPFSWLAAPKSEEARDVLGADLIPILRPHGGPDLNESEGVFKGLPDLSALKDEDRVWWMKSRQERWRQTLRTAPTVALRYYNANGAASGGTGQWIGVYRLLGAAWDHEHFIVNFDPSKLAEVQQ